MLPDGRDPGRPPGDHILLAPPFILEDGQLDEIVDKLDAALARVLTHS